MNVRGGGRPPGTYQVMPDELQVGDCILGPVLVVAGAPRLTMAGDVAVVVRRAGELTHQSVAFDANTALRVFRR